MSSALRMSRTALTTSSPPKNHLMRRRSALLMSARVGGYHLNLVSVRVVHVKGTHAFEHRMHARTNLDPGSPESSEQRLVVVAIDAKREMVQHTLRLLPGKLLGAVGVRD